METAKKIASNTFAQIAAKFVNAALSVLIVRIITGYLAAEGYGKYTLVYAFIAFFGIAADLGLFTIGVSEMAKSKEKLDRIIGNLLSIRLILVIILAGLASVLVFFVPKFTEEIRIGVMIAAVGMGVNLLMITLSSVLQVHLKMVSNAIALVVSKIAMVTYIYFAARLDLGFVHLIWAGLLNNVLALVITYFFVMRLTVIRLRFEFKTWKTLFAKSLPYGMSLVFAAIYLHIGSIILRQFWTDTDVGIYGVALRVFELLIIIPFAFMNSVLPSIARSIMDKNRLNDIIQNSFDFLATIGFGTLAGTLVLADSVIGLVSSGDEFQPSAVVLRLLSVAVLFAFLNNLFSYLLLALNRQKQLMLINAVAALLAVTSHFILIPQQNFLGSYIGVAISNIIPQIVVLIATFFIAKRILNFKLSFSNFYKIIIASTIMALAIWGLDYWLLSQLGTLKIVIAVPFGMTVFFVILLILRGISSQALEILFKGKQIPLMPIHEDLAPRRGLKIAVDIRAVSGERTGKEWYTYSLLEAIAEEDHRNHYYLYTRYKSPFLKLPDNFTIIKLNLPLFLWHPLIVLDMWLKKMDVLLATSSYIAPSLCFFKYPKPIVVIHDTVAFLFPKKHQWKATAIEKTTVGLALKNAYKIIAVSQNTRDDIIKLFKVNKEKIKVIAEASRKNFKVIDNKQIIQSTLDKHNLPNKFILFVGTLEPRKNLVCLIKSYNLLSSELKNEYKLVIVGRKGWYYKEIFRTVKEHNLEDKVIFTGYVPDEDLPVILNTATVFIMPSLYEGFGLPLLEAFACGTPVITSDNSALREVAGTACQTINPEDETEVAKVIAKVLSNPELRATMRAKGLDRVKFFTWSHAANEVLDIIEKIPHPETETDQVKLESR